MRLFYPQDGLKYSVSIKQGQLDSSHTVPVPRQCQHTQLVVMDVLYAVMAGPLPEALSQVKGIRLLCHPCAPVLSASQVCRKIKAPLLLLLLASGGLLWLGEMGSGPAIEAVSVV